MRYRARVQMHQLVARTIDATGVPSPVVRQVITAFIQEVKRGLIEDGSVSIERFGRMRLMRQKAHVLHRYTKEGTVATPVPFRIRLMATKCGYFKKQIHDYIKDGEAMEKYGVDERLKQEEMEKAAAEGCPVCGKALVQHGSVLLCPTHGTEPFEKEKHGKSKG